MSARREKHKRLQERALKAERENARLAELLLLHKPPLRCKIRGKLLPQSPSAIGICQLGAETRKRERCRLCMASARYVTMGFWCGVTGDPYPLALAKEVQRIYEEG